MGFRRISVLLRVLAGYSVPNEIGLKVKFNGRHDHHILYCWTLSLWRNLKELLYLTVVVTQMGSVARLHAAYSSVDTTALRRVHSSIPRHAQTCLHMYC
ncbi:hypothetical protein TNCV_1833671 [Trichonephila clavipes]|nr:hypothetical protein TNCV_1833671 [Trichonephila clavipes]